MDKTIKVFISQPIANRSEEEILNERLEVLKNVKKTQIQSKKVILF